MLNHTLCLENIYCLHSRKQFSETIEQYEEKLIDHKKHKIRSTLFSGKISNAICACFYPIFNILTHTRPIKLIMYTMNVLYSLRLLTQYEVWNIERYHDAKKVEPQFLK